jgi:hypothetical protein
MAYEKLLAKVRAILATKAMGTPRDGYQKEAAMAVERILASDTSSDAATELARIHREVSGAHSCTPENFDDVARQILDVIRRHG